MSAYGTSADMTALLKAMRDQALQDTTKLTYLRTVEITSETLGIITKEPSIFLVSRGSPEEVVAEREEKKVKVAVHKVDVMCVIHTASPHTEDPIIGTGREIGILPFADDVMDFFGGNLLGLAGLDQQNKPLIQAADNAYGTFQIEEEDTFLLIATLTYEAQTKPFIRG